MLSLYIKFMLQFSFIIHDIFGSTILENSLLSIRNKCKFGWHYLREETTCIIFATSQGGDVPWYDGHKACQTNSAELLTISNSNKIQLIQKKINKNKKYFDHIRRGVWIGKAKFLKDDLCDNINTTIEDFQLDCIILIRRFNDQSLCLKRVSCRENHPFICENTAISERELVESTMERLTWWKCILIIWCLLDDADESADEKKKEEDKKKEIDGYVDQFDFNMSDETFTDSSGQASGNSLMSSDFGGSHKFLWIGGGFLSLLIMCICCAASIYAYNKIKNRRAQQNLADRDGSFDSTQST